MKAKVKVGSYNLAIVIANFATEENGDNEIVTDYVRFCQKTYREVSEKLTEVARIYFADHNVEVESLTLAEIIDYARQTIMKSEPNKITSKPLTPDGKIIDEGWKH